MSLLIDTITLTGSLANVREALIAALRAKGFPIKDDESLCEIVDTINSGAVDYCGFVRCWVGGDSIYFPDQIEITLDTRTIFRVYDDIIVSDAAKLLAQVQRVTKPESRVVVQDYVTKRKQTKRYYNGLDVLGPCVDFCTSLIVHHTTDGKVYIREPKESDIIVQDTVTWQIFDENTQALLRSGS